MKQIQRILMVTVIATLLSYTFLTISRFASIPQPTIEGGWGTGLDASRQIIVDTGHIYTSTSYYSPWYFPRNVDQHVQILDAIISIVSGALDPVSANALFSEIYYPSFFLIAAGLAWFTWLVRRFGWLERAGGQAHSWLALYTLFAVFPTYTIIGMEIISYPALTALVFLFFFFTLIVRRLTSQVNTTTYAILLVICAFALFNMYHSTSLEAILMLGVLFFLTFFSRTLRKGRQSILLILAIYAAVGLYQNTVIVDEPLFMVKYFSDFQSIIDFALTSGVNQASLLGYPSTRLFGITNLVVMAFLVLAFLLGFLGRRRVGTIPEERLVALILMSAVAPLVALTGFGGLYFLVARFREQILIWVLLPVLPFTFLYFSRTRWRAVLATVLVIGIATSIAGNYVATVTVPQVGLTPQELATTDFIWAKVPDTMYVFTDWSRGAALMYDHHFTYGPDPYRMTPGFFYNLTSAMFYSDGPTNSTGLIQDAIQTPNYTLYLSTGMINSGPIGPDHAYLPAVTTLMTKFQNDPTLDVIYSNGETELLQSGG